MNHQYTTLADFQPWELEAHFDGEAMPHLAEFLARNSAALAELKQEQVRMVQIRTALYRFDCPAPETLQAYHWGELDDSARRRLATHLQECPPCNTELAAFAAFMAEPVTAPTTQATLDPAQPGIRQQLQELLAQVRIVVATLVTPTGPPLVGVALRGDPSLSASSPMLLFEADDTDVSVTAYKLVDGAYRVDGQVLTPAPLTSARYVLTSANPDADPVIGDVSSTGSFGVARLHGGLYQLVIKLPDRAIVVPNLTLI